MNRLDNYLENILKSGHKLNTQDVCHCILGKEFKKYNSNIYVPTQEDIRLAAQIKKQKDDLEKERMAKQAKDNNAYNAKSYNY
jgi:hypothetical protein